MTDTRCPWSYAGVDDAYIQYHDREWGVPVRDDRTQFEFLILEGAQAGLSWATILRKRTGYRNAFAAFDPETVARFDAKDVDRLLQDPGIVRNRLKILSAINNARKVLEIQDELGSFDAYLWEHVDGRPIVNHWEQMSEVPSVSPEAECLSRALKRRGFTFVGPTIIYAHMQAVGMVNDHLISCFRHAACQEPRHASDSTETSGHSRT
jgi:DNA-3-methyladenine glycosylase I